MDAGSEAERWADLAGEDGGGLAVDGNGLGPGFGAAGEGQPGGVEGLHAEGKGAAGGSGLELQGGGPQAGALGGVGVEWGAVVLWGIAQGPRLPAAEGLGEEGRGRLRLQGCGEVAGGEEEKGEAEFHGPSGWATT